MNRNNKKKTVEKQLIGLGDQLINILETMTDAFVSLDKNWCYTYMNQRAGEIFGRDPKVMIGKHIWTEFPEGIGQPFHLNYEKAMRDQVPVQMEEYYPPYDKWFENRIHPTPEGLAIFFQDITVRKKAELALKESEEKYRALVESANDSILIVQNGVLVFANHIPLLISGYSMEEVIGAPFLKFIAEEDRKTILEFYQKRIKGEDVPFHYETNIVLKNGERKPVEISISMFTYHGEKSELVFIRDISVRKQLEEARNLEQVLLKTLINYLPSSVFVKDRDFRKTACNPAHLRRMAITLGRNEPVSESEVLGKTDFEIYPETLAASYFEEDEQVIKRGESVLNKESFSIDKSGESSWELISKIPIRNEEGTINGMVGIAHDITERKKNEKILENERMMLRTLINTIPDLIWLKDPDGVYLICNPEFERLYGAKESEILGKTDYDFVPKELADFFRKNDDEAVKNGKPTNNLETLTYADDGHMGFFETIKTPMFDSAGKLIGVLGVARDITEIQQSRDTLAEKEKQLSSIYDTVGNVIFLIEITEDKSYKFSSVNQAFINVTGIPAEAVIGKNINDVIPEPSLALVLGNYRQAIATKSIIRWEETTNYPTGPLTGIVSVAPVFDTDGKCTHLVGSVNDITDRKKAEEEIFTLNQTLEKRVAERTAELETANKDLEAFAYSISHDLRAPLRHVDGYSRLLRKSVLNPTAEEIRFFDKISESSVKMSKMIDALLNFSRLGRKPVTKTKVDLDVMVKEIAGRYQSLTGTQATEFKIGSLPCIEGDPSLLQIVFENLISNAVKFTSKTSQAIIEIGVSRHDGSRKTIFIKDNGAGFDMAYTNKLFNVFQRLHTSEEFEGTGIGLANVKQIIHKHGGTISAEGQVDHGATFYITF
ncbi:MAG: PAS domain S-box protein [Bacteroidetes bacterium]|nr:PAS domain S-box protein [Bacteroidota bacterium]